MAATETSIGRLQALTADVVSSWSAQVRPAVGVAPVARLRAHGDDGGRCSGCPCRAVPRRDAERIREGLGAINKS